MKIGTLHKINAFLNTVISTKVLMLLMVLTQIMLYFGDEANYVLVMFIVSAFILSLWIYVVVMSLVIKKKIEFTKEGEAVYDKKGDSS